MPFKTKQQRAAYQRAYRKRLREAAKVAPETFTVDPAMPVGIVAAQWAERTLKVPTGPLRGQPFLVPGWQRDFLADALGSGTREAGLSVARKNGKSGLVAALCLAFLCGPLNRPQFRRIVVSLTGALAVELRNAIELTATASGLGDRITVRRSPFPGSIEGQNGAEVTILASDKATGHALAGC